MCRSEMLCCRKASRPDPIGRFLAAAVAAVAIVVAGAGPSLAGAAGKGFSLACENIPFSQCMERFLETSGYEVYYAKPLGALPVKATLSGDDPVAALRTMLESVGDGNHAVTVETGAKRIRIASMGIVGPQAAIVDPKAADQTPAAEAAPPQQLPNRAQMDAANRLPDPDAPTVGGMTYRQLKQRAEQVDLNKPDPETPFLPGGTGEKAITWGELQKRQEQVDKQAPQEYYIGGSKPVSAQTLKEHQARIDALRGWSGSRGEGKSNLPPPPQSAAESGQAGPGAIPK